MISKKDLKKVVAEWKEREIPKVIERDISINLKPNDIITFTGVRRAGKTFLLFLITKKLLKTLTREEIFYINFEHELLKGIKARDVRNLFKIHAEMYERDIKYILFDEIQKVKDWQLLLRRLYDERRYHIFVTGSSYELRPKELASSLRGRTINYTIFPLSFKEFLRFKNYDIKSRELLLEQERGKVLRFLNEFLQFGSFPDVVLRDSEFEKSKLITSYFDTILLRDIIEKHDIRNSRLLELFIKYLLSATSFYFSATKAENYFKSIGEKCSKVTLLDFFDYAEKAFLIFKTEIFSYKVKERKQYPVKVYSIDNGFVNLVNPRFTENMGALMENAVAIKLLKEKEDKKIEFYYWKDYQGREVDFVVKEGMQVKQLIQVCYDISDLGTKEREIKALLKASEELKCKNLLVITWDYESVEEVKGKKIKFVPLWKWLLVTYNYQKI